MAGKDEYCINGGYWSGNLKITQAFFENDLLDRGDELMQNEFAPVGTKNPLITIRSSPRSDGLCYMHTIRITPDCVEIDHLPYGVLWTLTKEGNESSDPLPELCQ